MLHAVYPSSISSAKFHVNTRATHSSEDEVWKLYYIFRIILCTSFIDGAQFNDSEDIIQPVIVRNPKFRVFE